MFEERAWCIHLYTDWWRLWSRRSYTTPVSENAVARTGITEPIMLQTQGCSWRRIQRFLKVDAQMLWRGPLDWRPGATRSPKPCRIGKGYWTILNRMKANLILELDWDGPISWPFYGSPWKPKGLMSVELNHCAGGVLHGLERINGNEPPIWFRQQQKTSGRHLFNGQGMASLIQHNCHSFHNMGRDGNCGENTSMAFTS
jgi:hypothetical protein